MILLLTGDWFFWMPAMRTISREGANKSLAWDHGLIDSRDEV